ncbi:hypothetical protein FisN_7Lh295 [Fistulifera solaris]|uniref:Uncharacterized protein n=1 Tax=Fistulifera solaris TaxID=1519565 RepID=A0A1Z5JRC7_FISSO|nr:hypothetical protein FisN_7Lh295 [Fistulifera solaris]|eukprot:GAX16567.1 hypothetical protein FisN_7Lh295 [Fistulifera solaris]
MTTRRVTLHYYSTMKRTRSRKYSPTRILAALFIGAWTYFYSYAFLHATTRRKENDIQPKNDISSSPETALEVCSSQNNSHNPLCCASWQDENTDEWWTRHYDWILAYDNQTHTCYSRIQDAQQLQFYHKLHQVQQQCQHQVQLSQISSGYAAALMAVARSFYAAYQSQHAFQLTVQHATANWNFSPKDPHHWAFCPTRDMNCFYLPLSSCPAEQGRNDAPRGSKPTAGVALQEFQWLRQYAFRVRHVVRQHVQAYWETQPVHIQQFVHSNNSSNNNNNNPKCTAIHVRRGDIAFGKGRRYAAVDEYLMAGNVRPGETVVLLTDDTSAIEEVERYLKQDQEWIYLDRPRTTGTALGFEGFIPSQDPAYEVVSILAELQLVSHCQKLVHGKSGFVTVLAEAMSSPVLVNLPIQLDKKQQPKMDPADRAQIYLQQIREHYEEREKLTKQR